MKKYLSLVLFFWGAMTLAHDEGHGPKLTDQPKQGGVVAPVVAAKDAKLGPKAALIYKGELVRTEDGSVKLYLYDAKMNALKLDGFGKTAKGLLETHGKKGKRENFELKLEGDSFVGKAPQPSKKPFNIDVVVTEKDQRLLAAFDNLD